MAMVSSLLCFSNYRSLIVAPAKMLGTLAAVTSKSTGFCSSIWDSEYHNISNSSRAFASVASTPHPQRYSEYGRLLPCPAENFQPRIEHLVVKEGGTILNFITKALDLPPLYVADLIHFGAVFYALVCPKPPLTATPEEIKLYNEVTDPSVLKLRPSIKGKTVREAQNTFRITHTDQFVEAGTYVRVHVRPKRFPRCYEIDWRSRIIAVTDSYVVLNKPAGTSEKQVKKLYLALVAAYVPCGVMTHYMRPLRMAPKVISKEHADFIKGWNMCQLEVLECIKVPWPNDLVEKAYGIEDISWPNKEFAYQCKISLLTGRTHQIRAQLAACGAPIVGDSMYMPAAMAELASPGLNPFGEYKQQFENEVHRERAAEEWAAKHGKEPGVAIGLQACQISWDEGDHFYEAGPPWWAQQ
ncbi:hypothetical protein R6Q59_027287 [Mikania micrantha]